MTVYIDSAFIPYRRMLMSHMFADTHEELLAMANTLGIARRYIQDEGTYREHFDICKTKRAMAVKCGAKVINRKQVAALLRARNKR